MCGPTGGGTLTMTPFIGKSLVVQCFPCAFPVPSYLNSGAASSDPTSAVEQRVWFI